MIPGVFFSQLQYNYSISGSVGYSFGEFEKDSYQRGFEAPILSLAAEMERNRNLFLLSYSYGQELEIIASSDFKIQELNLLYGRKINITKWMDFRPYVGIGYLNINDQTKGFEAAADINIRNLSFPIKLRFNFLPDNNINFGIDLSAMYSKNAENRSPNLFLRYNFQ